MIHFNGLSPAEAERLACLMEEMSEASQVIGKILRHGYESKHPNGGPTNRELLYKEMMHVWVIWGMFKGGDMLDFDETKWNSVIDEKKESLRKYLHHQ